MGSVNFDIANMPFEMLPPEFQRSNALAAKTACDEVLHAVENDVALDTVFIERAAELQHQLWTVNRCEMEAAAEEGSIASTPYSSLPESEKEKNREIIRIAVDVFRGDSSAELDDHSELPMWAIPTPLDVGVCALEFSPDGVEDLMDLIGSEIEAGQTRLIGGGKSSRRRPSSFRSPAKSTWQKLFPCFFKPRSNLGGPSRSFRQRDMFMHTPLSDMITQVAVSVYHGFEELGSGVTSVGHTGLVSRTFV